MAMNEKDFASQIMSGNFDMEQLQGMSSDSLTSAVNISDLGACYSSTTNQLSVYCTVTAANSGDNVTGVGLIAYRVNSSTMICLQYTNDFSSPSIMTSIGTNLYTTSMGNSILVIIYGYTAQAGFYYISDTLSVGSC